MAVLQKMPVTNGLNPMISARHKIADCDIWYGAIGPGGPASGDLNLMYMDGLAPRATSAD